MLANFDGSNAEIQWQRFCDLLWYESDLGIWLDVSRMAIGQADPVLGEPVMRALHAWIRNCPEPMLIAEGGHFLQEWGEPIARAALTSFGLGSQTHPRGPDHT